MAQSMTPYWPNFPPLLSHVFHLSLSDTPSLTIFALQVCQSMPELAGYHLIAFELPNTSLNI